MLGKNRSGLIVLSLLLSLINNTANANTAKTAKTVNPGRTICLAPSKSAGVAPTRTACDFTFTALATFACGASPQSGTYTIRNNTPVTMKINYIRIQNNDAHPTSDVTITANTCGATLASGASCSVTVLLATNGPYSRILQIGIDSRQVELDSPVITPTTGCNTATTPAAPFTAICSLGTTSTYATLAGTTITNTGPTILNGDLGLSPGTSVTGFPPGVVNGTQNITNAAAAAAQVDLTTLYNCLAAQPCGTTIGTANQAGNTLTGTAGAVNVYCSGSSILVDSGTLTLNGNGNPNTVFIFQAGSTLTLSGTGASIVLTNGAQAQNVFWQVGSSATLGTSSIFNGTVAAFTSITMNTGATMVGRALARNAAVTFDTNTVNLP